VWLSELSNYSVNVGVAEANAISKLHTSDWNWKQEYVDDVLKIEPEFVSTEYSVERDILFETGFDCAQTRSMQLMIDALFEGDPVELDF
jgi:hypothetical protein